MVEGRGDILISDFDSATAQVLADRMLYYQTSMGPQFVLAGIPTIQVGHEPYEDILVRNRLCSVATSADQFLHALQQTTTTQSDDVIKQGLGIHPDWDDRLANAIKQVLF